MLKASFKKIMVIMCFVLVGLAQGAESFEAQREQLESAKTVLNEQKSQASISKDTKKEHELCMKIADINDAIDDLCLQQTALYQWHNRSLGVQSSSSNRNFDDIYGEESSTHLAGARYGNDYMSEEEARGLAARHMGQATAAHLPKPRVNLGHQSRTVETREEEANHSWADKMKEKWRRLFGKNKSKK